MDSMLEQEGGSQQPAAPTAYQAVNFRIDLGDDPSKFNYLKHIKDKCIKQSVEVLPLGASAEQLFQYNTRQRELAAARASIMARFNLEEDAFGLVRSRNIVPTPISPSDVQRLSVAPSPHMEAAHFAALQDVTPGRLSLAVTPTPQTDPSRPPIPRPYLQT
jgi:hypothetical protein